MDYLGLLRIICDTNREIVSVEALHMLAISLKSQLMDEPKHEQPAAARQESVQAVFV